GNLALSRDGAYLAVGGWGGNSRVRVWDVRSGEEPELGTSSRGGVAFAPDRPLLAFTHSTKDAGEVVFWDARERAERRRFDWGLAQLTAVAFSPDGLRCASANRTQVVTWDVDV